MDYTFESAITGENTTIKLSEECHEALTQNDRDIAANDKKHDRCDRKHQHGQRNVSFDEIPAMMESARPDYVEVIRETAVYIPDTCDNPQAEMIARMLTALETLPPKRQEIIRYIYLPNESYLYDERGLRKGSYDEKKELFIPTPRKKESQLIAEYAAANGCTTSYVRKERNKAFERLYEILRGITK